VQLSLSAENAYKVYSQALSGFEGVYLWGEGEGGGHIVSFFCFLSN